MSAANLNPILFPPVPSGGKQLLDDPRHPGKHIDPATGCWPISEWGRECGRGFVSDERFQRSDEKIIKRTNRAKTKEWYRSSPGKQ